MNEKLRDKLAEWAGFQWLEATDGNYYWFDANGDIVSPTDEDGNVIWDMNACFKWLVPKLVKENIWHIEMHSKPNFPNVFCWRIEDNLNLIPYVTAIERTSALALCLAIEKLIDGEK